MRRGVIELLAGTMGRGRGRIDVVEDDMRQTYTVKHIRKGLTLLNPHQHHFSETPVFAGCGVRAVGLNETNTY